MRIVLNGQQPFGAEVFHALRRRGDEVVAVYCAPDRPDAGADPLRRAAEEAGVDVRQPASFKDDRVAADLRELEPDLMVMAFVTLLVPGAVLSVPRLGSIQYHPSLLPRHRGPSAVNWAIAQGDETTGVTIFWPDDGLDTGPVLLTREVPIAPDDTVGSLYFDKLFPLGVEAMVEAVGLVETGSAPRIVQDESQATYESWCRKADVELRWSRPLADVHRLVRAGDPRPGAWTTHRGRAIDCFHARPLPDLAPTRPGEVLGVAEAGIAVSAADGVLEIGRIRAGGDKVPAAAAAHALGLRPGDVLGAPPAAG